MPKAFSSLLTTSWTRQLGVFLYYKFLTPKSTQEDRRRQESILNILLLSSLLLALITIIRQLTRVLLHIDNGHGLQSTLALSIVFLVFLALLVLSRRGFFRFSAVALMLLFFLFGSFTLLVWGILVAQGLMVYILVIVMSSILMGTRFALFTTLLSSASLIGITYLHTHGLSHPNLEWAKEMGHFSDAIGFSLNFGIIFLVSWLSSREIDRSLQRAHHSETALKAERDLLEVKVAQRSHEIERLEVEKNLQLYRFAEYGRLAYGLFHDLANPLTTISLNLSEIEQKKRSVLITRALEGTKQMERFMQTARNLVSNQKEQRAFSLRQETREAVEALAFRLQKQSAKVEIQGPGELMALGPPLRFMQIMINLLSNAVDAYEGLKLEAQDRRVSVVIKKVGNIGQIRVQDWGSGIRAQDLQKIFTPFFSTKDEDKGSGIGLSICKSIVESEFGGNISVKSAEGAGSCFTVEIPLHNPEAQ